MAFLTFNSGAELVVFITSMLVGISMIMGVNAVNSAPGFMLEYYKYIYQDENAVPKNPSAWTNILTIYTVVTQVTQMLLEPTNLTKFLQRFSLVSRLVFSSLLMLAELLVIVIMPHTCRSETAALTGLILAGFIGGIGRAYFENTSYALYGAFPSKYLTGVMIGVPLSGAIVSVLQIILLAAMPYTYASLLDQSVIYFAISIGLIALTVIAVVLLIVNPFAKRFVAEFRSHCSPLHNIYRPAERGTVSDPRVAAGAPLTLSEDDGDVDVAMNEPAEGYVADLEPLNDNEDVDDSVLPVSQVAATQKELALHEDDTVQEVQLATSAELLQQVRVWPVIQKVYPMMIACFLTFVVTYLMYPGILIAVDSTDNWFITLIMAVYNFGDLIGRLLSMWKTLWPPRAVLLIASIVRIIFIPLLMLCAFHKIPSQAAAYVFTILMGLSNGFVGTLTMVYSPETAGLVTYGERIVAGQLTGVCLLVGCAVGGLLQLAVVLGVN